VLGRRLLAEGYTARDLDLFASLAELYVLALERAPGLAAPAAATATTRAEAARTESEVEGSNATLAELRRRFLPLRKILGESGAILQLFQDLVEFADSRATILIQGESGTGKEVVAKAIHELSGRRAGPLEVVDCSSIPKELIESELFGHVRGAFTGAVRDRRGAFDLAHNGTIFLDEIGEMTLSSQTRLLRVLQEGKFRPVGGEKTHAVDVRVIAATNVDLRQAVRDGQFRKDLFFRIQVFPLRLPPLRERNGDVEVLTRAFLRRFYADYGLSAPEIEDEVFLDLRSYAFPGNVRELQNIAEALAIRSRAEGRVRPVHLAEIFRSMHIRLGESVDALHDDIHRLDTGTSDSERPVAPRGGPVPHEAGHRRGASSPIPLEGTTGEIVALVWRNASFNLLETSRQLRARRTEGEDVPVVDRAQLSHYLDGEILRHFLEQDGIAGTAERLAGAHPLRHRAVRRIRRVIDQLARALERGDPQEEFPRLPEEYREMVEQLGARGLAWIQRGLSEPLRESSSHGT
jgi:DNA-binding NtrC family response regulator